MVLSGKSPATPDKLAYGDVAAEDVGFGVRNRGICPDVALRLRTHDAKTFVVSQQEVLAVQGNSIYTFGLGVRHTGWPGLAWPVESTAKDAGWGRNHTSVQFTLLAIAH